MPYYITAKTEPVPTNYYEVCHLTSYATREEAFTAAPNKRDYVITFLANTYEREDWTSRERRKFESGEYTITPWHHNSQARYNEATTLHYAHLSLTEPGMVAYTPNDEYGVAGRHIRTRPGRYLTQFFKDVFDKQTIDDFAAECAACNLELQIARSTEDIVKIYSSTDVGFSSCMQWRRYYGDGECTCNSDDEDECTCTHDDERYGWQVACENDDMLHPVSVYGESDLGVAYRGPIDAVKQRAVVWPDKKQYVRIYGSGALETLLKNAGYQHVGEFTGAKIRRIPYGENKRQFYMPYVDSRSCTCEPDSTGLYYIIDSGDVSMGDTCGSVTEQQYAKCDDCGGRFRSSDEDQTTCNGCLAARYVCSECEQHFDSRIVQARYAGSRVGTICQPCYTRLITTCATEGCITEWIERSLHVVDRETRTRHHVTHLCRTCANNYRWCDSCETATDRHREGVSQWRDEYLDPQCPNCSRYPRCEDTGDLLAGVESLPATRTRSLSGTAYDYEYEAIQRVAYMRTQNQVDTSVSYEDLLREQARQASEAEPLQAAYIWQPEEPIF